MAISYDLPHSGAVFISVADRDKRAIVSIARDFARLGFDVVSTGGTAKTLAASGVACTRVKKVSEGHPNIADMIADGTVKLMINTPFGHGARGDGYKLRLSDAFEISGITPRIGMDNLDSISFSLLTVSSKKYLITIMIITITAPIKKPTSANLI